MGALARRGSLAEQLAQVVVTGTRDVQITHQDDPRPHAGPGFSGLSVFVEGVVRKGERTRREGRVFTLLEAHGERLPVIFLGDLDGLLHHRPQLMGLLRSIRAMTADHQDLY